jgi:hypothetical protein
VEGNQLVGRLECAAPQLRRNDRFHSVKLFGVIATRIDLLGRQSRAFQPRRHLADILCCLQDDRRSGVSEHMGRDALLGEAGTRLSGGRCMLLKQIGEAPSAQRLSAGADERLGRGDPAVVASKQGFRALGSPPTVRPSWPRRTGLHPAPPPPSSEVTFQMAETSPLRRRMIEDMTIGDLSPANPAIPPLCSVEVQPVFWRFARSALRRRD